MSDKDSREKRIEELLTLIGGCEVALLSAAEDEWKLKKIVSDIKKKKLKELRDTIYGLSE